jgi:phage terminase large subunit
MPALKASAMRDFFEILANLGLYDERNHNKSESIYSLNGNLVEFIGMDSPQKKRGSKRHRLWLNEANEFTHEDYRQLVLRTSGQITLDYNPSDEYHWIYDKVLTRNDCTFIKSTYKDAIKFLDPNLVAEIERLKDEDENYWRIYGLGERGSSKASIYTNWDLVDAFPNEVDEECYGLDFGFNNPTSLVRTGIIDKKDLYVDEIIYQSYLTNSQLIELMETLGVPKGVPIKADSADPSRIKEIEAAGYFIEAANKGKNSVKDGIDVLKRKNIHVTKSSANVQKEIKAYKWKEDKDGRVLDEPVKFNDHSLDALRYAVGNMDTVEPNIIWL